ncbi:TDRD5 protein, partial [Heliornis fulica]|nr:TDRD5 protein [Heliornis fulica]
MSKQSPLMELLKKEVRLLLVAAKDGLTVRQLEQEYMAMIGKPLPLRDLGFQSTLELVADMPDVVRVFSYEEDTVILKAIADKATEGIAKLVARQRKGSKVPKNAFSKEKANAASSSRNPQSFPQRVRQPVLPAGVKADLQALLSSSPLLLLDFDKAFSKRFGRPFRYTEYGFFSMFEVFRSVSDIIMVKHTREGALLTLKKYPTSKGVKEAVPRVVPTVEMPPLEPCMETESFYLTTEEKPETVETKAVELADGLKQVSGWTSVMCIQCILALIPLQLQDSEQSLLADLILTPEVPPDAVQGRSLCSLPPLKRRCMVGVYVEFIVSPTQFYIRICGKDTSDKLQDMMFEMRHCYSNKLVSDRYIMPESSIQPGHLCCLEAFKWWYRVIIHRVINDQEVEVFYTDYGNLRIVQRSCLRFLKWCYLKLPAQAIPCSLAWVKPVEDRWSSAATLLFRKLCGTNVLVGIVDEYVNGILHLFLCDTSMEKDVYFHSVLRDEGCAHICGENIPSQEFKELNPSALYIQPRGKQESAEQVKPDLHLQQESLDVDNKASSKLNGDKLCDQEQHLSDKEETQDDGQPTLDEVGVPGTEDQTPELAQHDTNEPSTDLMVVVKTRHAPGESLVPAVLLKSVEDGSTSIIYTKQPAEMSQDGPNQIERFSSKAQLYEVLLPSLLLMAIPFMPDNHTNEEAMKSRDRLGCLSIVLCSDRGLSDQCLSQRLYVPHTVLSSVLASARLALPTGYFQW